MARDDLADQDEFLARLKECIQKAGGASAVARKAGIPLGSINHYSLGREMKLSSAILLADACGVSLAYLAKGVNEGSIPNDSVRWVQRFGGALHKPMNFFRFCLLMASCQYFFLQMRKRPSLAQALEWVASPYAAGWSEADSLVAESFMDSKAISNNPWDRLNDENGPADKE